MSQKRLSSSLLSPQSRGGDIAEGGFQYQFDSTIAQIPNWLAQDGFTEMIREALGDAEAKFFVPSVGFRYELVEYKNYQLKGSKFWEEIEHFREIDRQDPDSYQQFVLACKSVTDELTPITNALKRVRDPYSFYDTAHQIQDTSYADFVEVVEARNKSKDIANFLFLKVRFKLDSTNAESHPRGLFIEEMKRYFPEFNKLSGEVTDAAYTQLIELVKSRRNKPIYRHELEKAIWHGTKEKDRPKSTIKIHTEHDENTDKGPDGCLQFDWKSVFGGPSRNFPLVGEWNRKVIKQLQSTKEWLISTKRSRHIHLNGHRRLSASVAIGSIFSAVAGFTIDIETKDGIWRTNSHAKEDTPDYQWQQSIDEGSTGEIAVGISILKDTANEEVERYLETKHFQGKRLYLFSNMVLQSDDQANRAVQKAKSVIQELTSKTQAQKIHLFFAGPAQFALFLGHRLNTLGEIQCYERISPNIYVPTVLIET
ncbi:SAVED domain-containing protein [Candidatus Poribacteria bacterium]|nr:SAVED domain-containing protein [Candidatus Poribacteria bacterium]